MSWPWNPRHYPQAAYRFWNMKEDEKKDTEPMKSDSTFASLWNEILEFGRRHLKKKEK